jgi:hypothetical protein
MDMTTWSPLSLDWQRSSLATWLAHGSPEILELDLGRAAVLPCRLRLSQSDGMLSVQFIPHPILLTRPDWASRHAADRARQAIEAVFDLSQINYLHQRVDHDGLVIVSFALEAQSGKR